MALGPLKEILKEHQQKILREASQIGKLIKLIETDEGSKASGRRGVLSPEGRAKIAAAAKKRWEEIKKKAPKD